MPTGPGTPVVETPTTPIPATSTATGGVGPSFEDRSFFTVPASGASTGEKPRWPTEPPTVGQHSSPSAPPADSGRGRKVGLAALALLLAAAVAGLSFFLGRGVSTTETVPVASEPTSAAVESAEPTAPPATPEPAPPTAVPEPERAAPAPLPLPADAGEEPVVAVASAVAPAVVLIQNELGQGSGIVYDESGLILTNAHVVGQFTEVRVTLASGVIVPGVVLGADPLTDVAVVDIDTDSEFGVAVLAPDSSVQVGQLAVAIGSPFGLEQTVTSGVVSAVGRVLLNPTDDGQESIVAMIQTDAPINPGNSGGALADREGRVIGMNTSIRTDGSGGNIGVGFAIPSDTARLIADRIVAGEPLEQGFLGVSGITPVIGKPGVVIQEVIPGSGAEAAGLLVGDLVTEMNGKEIKSLTDLAAAVRLLTPNEVVTIGLDRDGEPLVIDVTLTVFEAPTN